MDFSKIHSVYFLGIGGIGMSALARYFLMNGKTIGGYDLTSSPLTKDLEDMDMQIHYTDSVEEIPTVFLDTETTLVVRTPAVPAEHSELQYFIKHNFNVVKRAEVLGQIFNQKKGIAVAGTHGKTSVTTFTSFLLTETGIGCSAFLGGISKNFNSNLVLSKSDYIVAEADEFDRSFLQLYPEVLLITTIDADHLDIYKDLEDIKGTFQELVGQVSKTGTVLLNKSIKLDVPEYLTHYTYALSDASADFYASNIRIKDGAYCFDLNTPTGVIENLEVVVPGKTNVENAIAAMAIAFVLGAEKENIKSALPKLRGAVRRFDLQFAGGNKVYIDDYAHHPRELDAVISSVKELYPDKKLTVIFQPHLYTRTRDFKDEFAKSLSAADELILLEIYPAREKPLPGITSEAILKEISLQNKMHCSKENLLRIVKTLNIEVLLTVGAGDIDRFVHPLKELFEREEI